VILGGGRIIEKFLAFFVLATGENKLFLIQNL
jgi:hypothetical protein